jgi:cob(I)alamin adenosyltransferase
MPPVMNRQDSYARAARAARLRGAGRTWDEIARAEGFATRHGALAAVRRHQQREAGSPDNDRHDADEGLRVVQSMLFATMAEAHQQGDVNATLAAAKAVADTITKRVSLKGLAVPQRQEVAVQVQHSATAILDRAEADLLALAQPDAIDAEVIE